MSDSTESFSEQVKKRIAERRADKAEKADKQQAKVEAFVEKVKDPNIPDNQKDREAALLFRKLSSALQQAVNNLPGHVSDMGSELGTYKQALDSQGKMQAELPAVGKSTPAETTIDSGELTKTITSLRELHKQLGLPEYKVRIDIDPEELKKEDESLKAQAEEKNKWTASERKEGESEEKYNERKQQHEEAVSEEVGDVKQKLTRKKVAEKVAADVAKIPDEYAEQRIMSLCEETSHQEEVQQEISDTLPQRKEETSGAEEGKPGQRELYKDGVDVAQLPSRASVRVLAFEIQRSEDRKEWREEQILGSINDPDVTEELHRIRDERRGGNTGERRVPWQERSDQERRRLVIERNHTFQDQIRDSLGEKSLEAYNALSGSEKRMVIENVLRREVDLDNAINAVDGALGTGNAAEICGRLNEAKRVRQDLKDFMSVTQVRLAAQRAENAVQAMKDHVNKEFSGGKTIKIIDVIKLAGFAREAVAGKVGEHIEPLKQGVLKAVDEASALGEGAADKLAEGYTRTAGFVHENIGRRLDEASRRSSSISHERRARSIASEEARQRAQIDISAGLTRRVGVITREFDRSKRILASEWAVAKRRVSLDIRKGVKEFLGGPMTNEEREAFERKKKRLSELQDYLVNERGDRETLRTHRKSPAYDYFWNDAMQYVEDVGLNQSGEALAPDQSDAGGDGTKPTESRTKAATSPDGDNKTPRWGEPSEEELKNVDADSVQRDIAEYQQEMKRAEADKRKLESERQHHMLDASKAGQLRRLEGEVARYEDELARLRKILESLGAMTSAKKTGEKK